MKNPVDVLRMKEQEILKIKIEIEALRITARLLSDDLPSGIPSHAPTHSVNQRPDIAQLVEMP